MGRKLTPNRAVSTGAEGPESGRTPPHGLLLRTCRGQGTLTTPLGLRHYTGTWTTRRQLRNGPTATAPYSIAEYTEAARVGETAGATVARRAADP